MKRVHEGTNWSFVLFGTELQKPAQHSDELVFTAKFSCGFNQGQYLQTGLDLLLIYR